MIPADVDAAAVEAVAMDLDRTILPHSLELTDRLVAAVAAVRATGVRPIIATGRMFRSARPEDFGRREFIALPYKPGSLMIPASS